jgi:AcrR family transcriptional regulator
MARPASDISERIVRAARDRFLNDGVEGASLRAIARDAGTNLGMVYYYYPSKDDLFLAVVEEVYAKLLEDLSRSLAEAGLDTRARVERMYARLAAVNEDEVKVMQLILREAIASSSGRIGQLFERFSRGHIVMVGSMMQQGMQRGEVRSELPPMVLVMSTLFLGLLPQIVRRRLGEAKVPVDALLPQPPALAEVLARVLLDGISPREGAQAARAVPASPVPKAESPAPVATVDAPQKAAQARRPVKTKKSPP